MMYGSYETSRQGASNETNTEFEAIHAFQNVERLLRSSDINTIDGKTITEASESMRRSISEQLEGITRLPILLDTYPHPHLAQHSMLYLADVFLKGQNFQRQCIAATLRRCNFREFPSLEEFLRRIMQVQHQNDFTARASLLSVLGAIAEHVAGNRSVSHLVRRSLDSLDDEEQDAAIWASEQLIKVDGEFARATIGHVVKMLTDPSIPLNLHGRLINILGSSHSSAADDSFQSLSHHLKGLNTSCPMAGTNMRIASRCANQLLNLAIRIPQLSQPIAENLIDCAIKDRGNDNDPRLTLRIFAMKCLNRLATQELVSKLTLTSALNHINTKIDDDERIVIQMIRLLKVTVENHSWSPDPLVIETLHQKFVETDSFDLVCEICACLCTLISSVKVQHYIIEDVILNLTILLTNEQLLDDSPLIISVKKIVTYIKERDESVLTDIIQILIEKCEKVNCCRRFCDLICYITWRCTSALMPILDSILKLIASSRLKMSDIYPLTNAVLMILPADCEERFVNSLSIRRLDCFALYRICRQCFRYRRYRLAAKFAQALNDVSAGYVGFEYEVYFRNLVIIANIESNIADIIDTINPQLFEVLNHATDEFDTISNEMSGVASVWLQTRSSIFRTISTFLQDTSKQPKRYLANELRENVSQISSLLLESRGAGKTCQHKFKFMQKILQSIAIIYEHGEENLIQKPDVEVEVFGEDVCNSIQYQFIECKKRLKKKQYVLSALSLLKIQIGFPKLFFVAPRVEQVKMDVTPGQSDTNKPHPRGTTLVLTCDGVLPHDVENIKLIYSVRSPFSAGKPGVPVVLEEFCQIKKRYFTSNFVLQFHDVGLHRLS